MSLNSSFVAKFNEICRTCLKGGQFLTYLFDEENNINLVPKLKTCTALQFDKNDRMPNKICPTCIEELLQAYNFINKCQISEATLKKYIINQCAVAKIEDDPVVLDQQPVKIEADVDENDATVEENFNVSDISIKDEFIGVAESCAFTENTKKRKRDDSVFDCSVDLSIKKNRGDCDNDLLSPAVLNSTFSVAESADVVSTVRRTRSETGKENFAKIKRKRSVFRSSHRKRRQYFCPVCPKKLKSSVVLMTHFQSHIETQNDKDDAQHSNTHLTEQITKHNLNLRCQICWRTFDEPLHLFDHYKQHVTTNKCQYCSKIFTLGHLRKHQLEKHSGSHPYSCQLCCIKMPDANALEAHKTQLHAGKKHRCVVCLCSFDTVTELKSHQNAHFSGAPYNCQSCTNKFENAHDLIAHKVGKKCGKFYMCCDCPEIFQMLKYRNLHKAKH